MSRAGLARARKSGPHLGRSPNQSERPGAGMDELAARRLARAARRLPDVETIVAMFETRLEARFKVGPELVTEARRRIREAARIFGRSVQTKYVRKADLIFGLVPLTEEEDARLSKELAKALTLPTEPEREK